MRIPVTLLILVVLAQAENPPTDIKKSEGLKLMPMSFHTNADNWWPTGLVVNYDEEDRKKSEDCYTIANVLDMSDRFSLFKAVTQKLGILQDLDSKEIPNFTFLVPTNDAIIAFMKRVMNRRLDKGHLNFTDISAVVNYMDEQQWDTTLALLILPETWNSFKNLKQTSTHMRTLEHKDAFYWKFRTLDDGTIKLRFEFKVGEDKVEELIRPVLVGLDFMDIPTCNGFIQVVDSMPF
eukprot:TRINITY_DN5940_c0_g2_i1.p1 TRINITY_DN5940_c0_g2~~TRINITY_DN5940_c0_g2_i1.p1  ORF type:complete len:236 (+),score=24.09 TRINITY_DN5940_c0_g2_i1:139-846(+)